MPESIAIRAAAALVPHALLTLREAEKLGPAERRRLILDTVTSAAAFYGREPVRLAFAVAAIRHSREQARAEYAAQIRTFLESVP